MLRKSLFILFVAVTFSVFAQTNVSGVLSSNTTWTLANSPYIVTGNVMVSSGITLTVEAGVVVKFNDNLGIIVNGALVAIGSPTQRITFTSNSSDPHPGDWANIKFSNSSIPSYWLAEDYISGSTVQYCDFYYAGNSAVYTETSIYISNSNFVKNKNWGVYRNEIYREGDQYSNAGGAITCKGGNSFIYKNLFYDNHTATGWGNGYGGAIFSNNAIISKNVFISNDAEGNGEGGAIYLSWGESSILNCNFIENSATGGSAIKVAGNAYIKNSTFLGNNQVGKGFVYYGYLWNDNIPLNNSNFFGNELFVIYNETDKSINARSNFWNSDIFNSIDLKIFDFYDVSTKGLVDYSSNLSTPDMDAPISVPKSFIKYISGSDVVITWEVNMEADVAGYKLYYGNPTGFSYSNSIDLGNVSSYTIIGGDMNAEYALTAYDSSADGVDDQVEGQESWFALANEPKVSLSSSKEIIHENLEISKIIATLNSSSPLETSVALQFSGTAVKGVDYSVSSETIIIPAGSLSASIDLTSIQDSETELTENIIAEVESVINASLEGESQTIIRIEDDDFPGVTLSTTITSLAENESLDITATLAAPISKDATVNFNFSGTATYDLDYTTSFLSKGIATTVAGGNGQGSSANQLNYPTDVSVDLGGNIYVLDRSNNRIQKWALGAITGTTIANLNGDVSSFFVDGSGNIYGVDASNHRIQKWTSGGTAWKTVAGGNGAGSNANQLNYPQGVYVDAIGNIFVADHYNHRVQKWTPGATTGTTVAGGNGEGSNANQLRYPWRVSVNSNGDIYIYDRNNYRIQKWIAGAVSGTTTTTTSDWFDGFYVDSNENIYGSGNSCIQKWTHSGTGWTIIAGGNGQGSDANQLSSPQGLYVNNAGNIYVADYGNHRIQKAQISPQIVILAGETEGNLGIEGIDDTKNENDETIILTPLNATNSILGASIPINLTITDNDDQPTVSFSFSKDRITENSPTDVILTATSSFVSGLNIDIAFAMEGSAIETVEYALSSKTITILAGDTTGILTISTNGLDDANIEVLDSIVFKVNSIANANAATATATLYLESDDNPSVVLTASKITIGENESLDITATLEAPTSKNAVINFGFSGTATYDLDYTTSFLSKGTAITAAGGNGYGSDANQLYYPTDVSVDLVGNIYVLDKSNNRIQKWALGAIAGTTIANLNGDVNSFFVDASGNIYGVDASNHRIQKWTSGGSAWTTVAGGNGAGSNANQLNYPQGVYVDAAGTIFVADSYNHRIQKWTSGATTGTTVAGGNNQGSELNQLNYPSGVSVDSNGNIYILDGNNWRIQKWTPNASSGTTLTSLAAWITKFFRDASGNIYGVDQGNHRVQKWTPSGIGWTTVAGGNGSGSNANQLSSPQGLYIDSDGNIYVADYGNHRIQKVQISPQIVISAGETEGKLTIVGIDDNSDENDETIVVTSSDVLNCILSTSDPVNITILDYDDQPEVSFSFSKEKITENDATDVVLTAKPSVVSGKNIAIEFVMEGSAIETVEYALSSKTITILAGDTVGILTISTNGLDDANIEVLDSIVFKVSSITNAIAASETVTLYLESDDNPSVALTTSKTTIGENESLDIMATLEAPTSKNTVINFDFSGTATYDLDYTTSFLSKGIAITIAGGNGQGSNANQLYYPTDVSVDLVGNIYVLDRSNNRIQKWALGAITGTTIAYLNGDVNSFFVDASGNIYGADANNHRIQKWTFGGSDWTTVAGGNGSGSNANQLNYPQGVYVDAAGTIFVADSYNHRIQKWTSGATTGTTVAGGNNQGLALNQLNYPSGVSVDSDGNIYILDGNNYRIQKWAPNTSSGTTLTSLNGWITKFFRDASGNIYGVDQGNHRIQKWSPNGLGWITVAGGNGQGSNANQLSSPQGTVVDNLGNIYVADYGNHRIQKVQISPQIVVAAGETEGELTIIGMEDELNEEGIETIVTNVVSTENAIVSGSIPLLNIESYVDQNVSIVATRTTIAEHESLDITLSLTTPTRKDVIIDFEPKGTALYDLDYAADFIGKGDGTTVIGGLYFSQIYPNRVFVDLAGNIYVLEENNSRVQKFAPESSVGSTVAGGNGWGSEANQFAGPSDIFVDLSGNIYVSDRNNHRIQKWAVGATTGTTVAGGNGNGSAANQLSYPSGVFVDLAGNIYVSEQDNHRVSKFAPGVANGIIVAGGNGQGSASNQLSGPQDVFVDLAGNIYIADSWNSRIQKWAPNATSGITVAGYGWGSGASQLSNPQSVFVDVAGSIYIADTQNHRIQKWAAGAIEGVTVAGGRFGQGSASNQLSYPQDAFVDLAGNIYVADRDNYRIQKYENIIRIILKAGETESKLSIQGLEDDLNDEGNETIFLGVKSGTNANLNSIAEQTITILDNRKTLTLQSSPFVGLTNGAVAWGDYDRDGDLDVAVMGSSPTLGAVTAVYQNQNGTFVNIGYNFMKQFDGDISWVDINKDGWLDLVVSGYSEQAVTKLYLNNAGVFEPTDDYGLPQLFSSKMAWGDLDNDGDIDLAISGINDAEEFVFYIYYRENNQNIFIKETAIETWNWPGFINGDLKIVDIDLDGDNDIIYSGENSSGGPVGGIKYNTYIVGSSDYYYDNYSPLKNSTIEVAKFQSTPSTRLSILFSGVDNNGNIILSASNFQNIMDPTALNLFPKLKDGDISAADFDNDGLNDLLFTGENADGVPITKLFLQNSSGSFRESSIQLMGLRNSTASWVDYDMDGDLDLFLTGVDNQGAKTILYEAETVNKKNAPPSKITGLDWEDIGNGQVRFSWDNPIDDFSVDLGYVLRLGTTPGGTELSNTESDLITGRRLISKPAPIYTNFFETQLDPGIYYWSLQAIDQGLKGGIFSEEKSFILTYDWKILNQGGIIDRRINAVKSPVIKLADLDNDNDMDLIYGSSINGGVQLLKFDGIRLINMNSNSIYVDRITDVETGDVNGDGIGDILINNFSWNNTYNLRLFLSNGSDYIQSDIDIGLYKAQGRIADLNNDGQAEVILIGLSSSLSSGKLKFYIYEYNKNSIPPSFVKTDVSAQITSLNSASFDLGDIDNDQDIDLIMSGFNPTLGYQSFLYENLTEMGGSYQFVNTENNIVATIDGTSDLIDFDGDGDLDLVITGTSISGDVFEVYVNKLNEGITTWPLLINSGLTPMRLGKLDLGDFNGDGFSDLLYSGVVEGQGKVTNLSEFDPLNNHFVNSLFDVSDIIDAEVEFGDLEGDGDLDFSISGESRTELGIYIFRAYVNVRNQSAAVAALGTTKLSKIDDGFKAQLEDMYTLNKAPATPEPNEPRKVDGAAITPDGVPVEFSWKSSIDDHTPTGGVTYSFKVGKAPGGEDIMSSNSNSNGTRKSAVKGNAEHNLTWRLRLPYGTYYWSVQAIDASFAGSEFSEPRMFQITDALGVENFDLTNEVIYYPNPTSGQFSVIAPGNETKAILIVRNLLGAILSQESVVIPTDRTLKIDISNLPAGMYIVNLETVSSIYTFKINRD